MNATQYAKYEANVASFLEQNKVTGHHRWTLPAGNTQWPTKNNYVAGVNGPVFETPVPGDNQTQSYVDTGKGAVILGFFFMGVAMLICWMECKTFCKTVTVFGH